MTGTIGARMNNAAGSGTQRRRGAGNRLFVCLSVWEEVGVVGSCGAVERTLPMLANAIMYTIAGTDIYEFYSAELACYYPASMVICTYRKGRNSQTILTREVHTMTLRQTTDQIFKLALGGYINHEKYTADRFYRQCRALLRNGTTTLTFEIALPDGWWFFEVNKYADRPDGYDYFIPETREQEEKLFMRWKERYGFQGEYRPDWWMRKA